MKKILFLLLSFSALILSAQNVTPTTSSLTLDPYFRGNSVIQRNKPVLISGSAEAGSTVTITLEGEKQQVVKVDDNGRWTVEFPEQEGSHKARQLVVLETRKDNSRVTTESTVRFGDVWICFGNYNQTRVMSGPTFFRGGWLPVRGNVIIRLGAGQAASGSNIKTTAPAAEKKEPVVQNPNTYWMFNVYTTYYASSPQQKPSPSGTWLQVQSTDPLYHFLDRIAARENVPVAAFYLGFTSISLPSLMPVSMMENLDAELCKEVLDDFERYKDKNDEELAAIKEEEESGKRLEDKPVNEGEKKGWHKANFQTNNWNMISLPGFLENRGAFAQVDGVFWFQHIAEIPKDFLRKIEPKKSEFQIRVIHPANNLYTNEVKLDKDFLQSVKVHNAEVIVHNGKATLVRKRPVFTAEDFIAVYSHAEAARHQEALQKAKNVRPKGMLLHNSRASNGVDIDPFRVSTIRTSADGFRFNHSVRGLYTISTQTPDFLIPTPEFVRDKRIAPDMQDAIMILNGKAVDFKINSVKDWRREGITLQNLKDENRQKVIDEIRSAIIYARHKDHGIILRLGAADDQDITYINGKKIGATGAVAPLWWELQRTYPVKAEDLKAGKNTIAVRVLDERQAGGLPGPYIFLENAAGEMISLHGSWRVREEWMVERDIIHKKINFSDLPTYGWNALFEPLKNMSFKGMILPDDEPEKRYTEIPYGYLLKQFVDGFRTGLNDENLPILYSLTPGMRRYKKQSFFLNGKMEERLVDLRAEPNIQNMDRNIKMLQEQLELLDYSNTYAIPTSGIEEADGMSPMAIRFTRLAALALREVYEHKDIVGRGPTLLRADFGIGKVTLTFDTGGRDIRMMVKGDTLHGFELTESKGKGEYVEAQARITGENTIEVWSDTMMRPSGVRYNITWCPIGNLYNTAGFPALPFQYGE